MLDGQTTNSNHIIHVMYFQVIALLLGAIYFGQELNQKGVMNINGAMFLFLTNMTFQNVFAVINVRSFIVHTFFTETKYSF